MKSAGRSSVVSDVTSASIDGEALHQLVAAVQRGDRPAADRLVRDHDSWVRSVIYGVTGRPELVEDVAQQVWAQVWQRLGSLKDPQRLRPWLYRVARHAALDASIARRRNRTRIGELEQAGDVPDDERLASPVEAVAHGELRTSLLRAVEGLPALYREPFVLRHLEDWSYAEIGQLLGLPVETVETRLVRARRLLREALSGQAQV